MTWLSRLKKISEHTKPEATKPTKPGFAGFVAPTLVNVAKNEGDLTAANDPAPTLVIDMDTTNRPPGLSPALPAASVALDDQIAANDCKIDPAANSRNRSPA
jgi:hypothetical protein